MQMSEAPDLGISVRAFDVDGSRSQLAYHFVDVMHSKVNHPTLIKVSEIFGRLGKGSERGRPSFLLPNGPTLARRCRRDSQVLQVPLPQCFGVMSSEEEPSDTGYFFPFCVPLDSCLAASFAGGAGLAGCAGFCAVANPFRGRMKLVPESIGQDLK